MNRALNRIQKESGKTKKDKISFFLVKFDHHEIFSEPKVVQKSNNVNAFFRSIRSYFPSFFSFLPLTALQCSDCLLFSFSFSFLFPSLLFHLLIQLMFRSMFPSIVQLRAIFLLLRPLPPLNSTRLPLIEN